MKSTFLFPMLAIAYGMIPEAVLAQGNCNQTQISIAPTCVIEQFTGKFTMVYKLTPQNQSSCTMTRTSMQDGWGFPSYIRGYTNESNPGHQPRPYNMAAREINNQDYNITQSPSTFVCLNNIGTNANNALDSELVTNLWGSPTTTQYVVSESAIEDELCTAKLQVGALSGADYQNLVGACNAQAILPVKLTQFSANQQGNAVKLSWESATETNFSHYSVERSQNGQSFAEVARVQPSSSLSATKKYQHTDALSVGLSRVYYRLKMVDLDGSVEYSRVLVIRLDSQAGAQTLYPNPAPRNTSLTLTIQSPEVSTAQIRTLDANGKVLRVISTKLSSGMQTLTLEGIRQPGLYIVEVQTAAQKTTHRVIVQ